jgi:argininosuccinate lyase
LSDLSLEEFQSLDPIFDANVEQVFDPQRSVARRNVIGGTAPEAVKKQIQNAKGKLA